MSTFNPRLTKLDASEVRRYAGVRGETRFPEEMVIKACADALLLISPQTVWRIYRYDTDGIIAGPLAFRPAGTAIARHLAGAGEVAVLAASVGPHLETEVTRLFAAGEYTAGLLLDAAGTTAVEAAADAANVLIADQAARRGLLAKCRFSPGYGDWTITDQAAIVALAGGASIGIMVTETSMLVPRKSVSAVIGLAPGSAPHLPACRGPGCAACADIHCMARKEKQQ